MRALGGAALIFTGILVLFTGWGAFAGILLIIAGVVIWGWGAIGSQQDESIEDGIIDPNPDDSGLNDPNQ